MDSNKAQFVGDDRDRPTFEEIETRIKMYACWHATHPFMPHRHVDENGGILDGADETTVWFRILDHSDMKV